MDITQVTAFFFWCSVFNGSLLFLWVVMMMFASDLVYRTQYRWFPLSKEVFAETIYRFLGLYKLMFLMFNLVPWLVLELMI